MKRAHVLCQDDGITAELLLGALVDAGAPVTAMQEAIDRTGLGVRIVAECRAVRQGTATWLHVETSPDAPGVPTPAAMEERITAARLAPRAEARAHTVVAALVRAEAAVHDVPVDAVHLHELGRPRTMARIIAVTVALEHLDVAELTTSPVALGGGVIDIAHGRFPVPPPAVLHLLRGFEVHGDDRRGELTTPSGAALLTSLASPADGLPRIRLEAHGRGAVTSGDGDRDRARILTVVLGTAEPISAADG